MWFVPGCTAGLNAGFSLGDETDNPDKSNVYLNLNIYEYLKFILFSKLQFKYSCLPTFHPSLPPTDLSLPDFGSYRLRAWRWSRSLLCSLRNMTVKPLKHQVATEHLYPGVTPLHLSTIGLRT